MKKSLRPRLTFANVISCLALFVALGGSAYAATQLRKNSVGSRQLKKNSVTGAKVKDQSLTGADINLSSLGTVASATNAAHATVADSANSIPPAEATHLVGTPGQPPFGVGAGNFPSNKPGITYPPVGFFKDQEGIVHLEGLAKVGKGGGIIFTLPPGYRPASGILEMVTPGKTPTFVAGSNVSSGGKSIEGDVLTSEEEAVTLTGITFRAGS
jgi:hypothetical protein